MGSRGPLTKADGRQGHRPEPIVRAIGPSRAPIDTPPSPRGLLKEIRAEWDVFWSSDIAGALTEVDHAVVVRLFRYRDEHARCWRAYRRARVVSGSKGQPRLSPLAAQLAFLDGAIARLERELGCTPLSRARLGLVIGEGMLTAAAVNAMVDQGGEHGEETGVLEAEVADRWRRAN